MSSLSRIRDAMDARWPAPDIDAQILGGHGTYGSRAIRSRADYLVSPRYRRMIASGLRKRPWVRDRRISAAYEALVIRLESPAPVTAPGMLRLVRLLQTAPSAVAVGCPESVVRELSAINYLFECHADPADSA